MFVPNFKILGQVVPEKSLTEKKFTHKHTHGKSKNYIPPIYFVYGGIKMGEIWGWYIPIKVVILHKIICYLGEVILIATAYDILNN